MVDVIGRAKVIVETDVDPTSANAVGGKIGSALKKGAVVGVAALGTLAVAGVKAFTAFEEAESQSRKLANVLSNMGVGAAAGEVEKLASALQRQTGASDEAIKGGQTILATFSQVATSAGVLGGVFERATELSLDLAAAGFGSIDSAAKMLGKALQDPEKGLNALSRAGVTFTEEQKTLIEGFLKVNDVASAQKLILAEVEKQVGGTAEASATEGAKIKEAFGELQETFGSFIDDVASGGKETKTFSDRLFELNEELQKMQKTEAWKAISTGIRGIGKAIEFVGKALDKWAGFWEKWGEGLRGFVDGLRGLKEVPSPLLGSGDFLDLLLPGISGAATGGPRSGWTVVGERGPELVNLPTGSNVHSNINSRNMLAGTAPVTQITNYQFYGPESFGEARRNNDWATKYGGRFQNATAAV